MSLAAVCLAVGPVMMGSQAALAQDRAVTEDFRLHSAFLSKFLSQPRDVVVWLPPGYATDVDRHFPVLYMHDGANVFVSWRIDDIAKPLIESGAIEPLLVVMVANGGTDRHRFDDYTPTKP